MITQVIGISDLYSYYYYSVYQIFGELSRCFAKFCIHSLITMTACSSSGKEDTSQTTATTEKAEEKPVYDPDASCTIFINMCGSNLESKQGLAGKDIDELLSADIPENVNVVIETGGSKKVAFSRYCQ